MKPLNVELKAFKSKDWPFCPPKSTNISMRSPACRMYRVSGTGAFNKPPSEQITEKLRLSLNPMLYERSIAAALQGRQAIEGSQFAIAGNE